MFTCFAKPALHIVYPPVSAVPYRAAGVLFLEGPVALAGVQKHRLVSEGKLGAKLSGFGGRKEEGDIDWVHTAYRETIEELFDVEKVPFNLINELRASIPYREHVQSGSYFNLRLTFEDLKTLLRIAAKHLSVSPLYKKMPLTLDDLILRRSPQGTSEIGALALVPVFQISEIDSDFAQDLQGAAATLRAVVTK
jgi:hypothetical protein